MTDDDIELIHSPLTQTHCAEGHTLRIHIYRGAGEPWILEIEDELGTSTVWDAGFDTDQAALDAAFEAINEEGAHRFVTQGQLEAKAAEPELLRKLAQLKPEASPNAQGRAPKRAPKPAPRARSAQDPMAPLTEDELDRLEQFLLDLDAENSMTLDMLDGFLHAIAIGPEAVMPSQWMPKVWGQAADAMMPPAADLEEVNHVVGWVMRHYNAIVTDYEQQPPQPLPLWPTVRYGEGGDDEASVFDDAQGWAHGFTEGVQLNRAAWQPLFDDPMGARWYRPIGLLGAADFSADQDALTLTPEQREALAADIEESLLGIHAFWLPLRQAVHERRTAQRISAKVGRNDLCPCGSGKKFKKCCGSAAELH